VSFVSILPDGQKAGSIVPKTTYIVLIGALNPMNKPNNYLAAFASSEMQQH